MEIIKNIFVFNEASPLLFTQFYFWVFFAVVLIIMTPLRNKILMRNAFLCAASLFFYYKTSGIFLSILLAVTLLSWLVGKWIYKQLGPNPTVNSDPKFIPSGQPVGAKIALAVGVIINLLVLCYFKYAYFIVNLINDLFGTQFEVVDYFAIIGNLFAGEGVFRVDAILLPVGISFYIFQCISYLMDIYRMRIKPVANLIDYGFYVSFFPQLVAGPIVRANEFVHQIYRPYNLSRRHFGMAVFWIMNGLVKKIVLSDYIAVNFIDRVFENPTMYSGFENLTALFGYSLQVYADFSGYTDIATGIALIMGFYLPQNFNSPYKATNAGNFWKRWHMSLSRWLQDYLYIPMGGNRKASAGTYIVIILIAAIGTILSGSIWVAIAVLAVASACAIVMILVPSKRKLITTNINSMNTMLLGGLWHGASWNFMIWGGLNGIGMIIYKFWKAINVYARALLTIALTAAFYYLSDSTKHPVANIGLYWMAATAIGASIAAIAHLLFRRQLPVAHLTSRAWAITQTFVFITFTRLFFRAGSNLDPAEANRQAWETATNMVNQIGSHWNLSLIPAMTANYATVFALIIFGLIVHWLPERLKRRYRLAFAMMPLPLMAVVVAIIVFIVYQFVTADLQKFIYFQF